MTHEFTFQLTTYVIITVVFSTAANGHVALTFPRARNFDLDFLDNARTPGPCGMPRGHAKTQLLAGSKFNITWHLAYPHNGGFKLQILDALDRPLIDLTPVTQLSEFVQGDATAQNYPVKLPQNFTCTNCTVRLLREAEEWGSNYRFWSCADIDILDRKFYREDCNGHGRYLLGKCRCDRLYHGLRCEFKDDCVDDSDCGNQGVCVDNSGTTTYAKYCYCNTGWYGPGCTKKSIAKPSEIDLDAYTKKRLSDDFIFYWRILKDTSELEGVMVVNSTSWVAIGWRPTNLTSNCRAFPELHDKDLSSHPKLSLNSNLTKNLSKQNAEQMEIEPQFHEKTKDIMHMSSDTSAGQSKSSAQRRSAKQLQTELPVTPRLDSYATFQTSVTYKISTRHGRKRRSSETVTEQSIESERPIESKPAVVSTLFDSNPNRGFTSEPGLTLQGINTDHDNESGTTKAPLRPTVHRYTPKHDFNPMDCTDMIIGMAKNNTHRIGDYYTRDRSTPRLDVLWGGKDSLTAVTGFEIGGVTTIMFRKPLEANEPTDYNILDTDMQVIWAKGQEPGSYYHQPPSGLEKKKASVQDFYKPDELKYHGHRSQRGVAIVNFYDEKKPENSNGHDSLADKHCGGEWKYPRSCSIDDASCEYYIQWVYKPKNDQITFNIMTRNSDVWTGVGFSDNGKMTQTDAVLGWVDNTNGRPFVMDTWISGYNAPLLDPSQDIYNTSGKIENGVTYLTFSRKRDAKDIKDLSFTDDHCLYMIFPVKGGIFNSVNKKIRKHDGIPIVSSNKICIKSCGIEREEDKGISKIAAKEFHIDIQIKLVNLGDGFIVPPVGSHEFNIISSRITDNFGPILSNVSGYHMIKLNELRDKSENGVIANMNLILDRVVTEQKSLNTRDTLELIENALKQTLVTGKVGSLTVDPQHLVITALHMNEILDKINDEDENAGANIIRISEAKLYVIIGCFAALTALALLQVSCTLIKTNKKSTMKQERLIANYGWKDYSTGAKTNFGFEGFETEEKASSPSVPSLPRFQDSPDIAIPKRSEMVNPMEKDRLANQQISSVPTRTTYSLPRAPGSRQQSPPPQLDYYTQDRRNNRTRGHSNGNSQVSAQQPDFYFMPSQRKYSGEIVRVYVDYGNQKSK